MEVMMKNHKNQGHMTGEKEKNVMKNSNSNVNPKEKNNQSNEKSHYWQNNQRNDAANNNKSKHTSSGSFTHNNPMKKEKMCREEDHKKCYGSASCQADKSCKPCK